MRMRLFRVRFGLKTLLGLTSACAIGCAYLARWHEKAVEQRDAVARVLDSNLTSGIGYENEFDPHTDSPFGIRWLGQIFDVHHFYHVVEVKHLFVEDDEDLRQLAPFPNLKVLDLAYGAKCTRECVLEALRRHRKLESLDLGSSIAGDAVRGPTLDDEVLREVCNLPLLARLNFDCGDNVTDAGLAPIAMLKNLNSLQMRCGKKITDNGLAHLGSLQLLKELSIDFSDSFADELDYDCDIVTPVFRHKADRGRSLEYVGKMQGLVSLTLDGRVVFDGAPLSQLRGLPHLASLQLWSATSGINDETLAQLFRLSGVETLLLQGTQGTESDAGLEVLSRLPNLSKLHLVLGPKVTDKGLEVLARCPELQRLRLDVNRQVTGDCLAKLTNLFYLELTFERRPSQEDFLASLAGFDEGQSASEPEVSSPFQLHLPPQLGDLVLHNLDDLTGVGVEEIANLKSLRYLDFFWCQGITDQDLQTLTRIKTLKVVAIRRCDATTAAGIVSLQKSLPNCRVFVSRSGDFFSPMTRF